jgi:Leucine-rich repeat (LRR) protein
MNKLKVLKLNSNCLKMLPMEIGFLEELNELDVSDNKLFCIPDSLCNLDKSL